MNRTPKWKVEKGIDCIALIRPGSDLDRLCNSEKLTYCIYESAPYNFHEIRFGNGSWRILDEEELKDLILVPELGKEVIDDIFP